MFPDPRIIEGVRILREKYDFLRKEIEEIITEHTNSTCGLDADDIVFGLTRILKEDNEKQIPKGVEQ